ncbi:sensor histidine kinase [Amycolatopsis acidicola]|uniref:sensor histidine kinase n=1 Tax=Amycolatopsis acidicola TaxID=2596893 RepID=UPI001FB7A12D|nr:sensor histidine kinase [Amycolatopsis acidicola]
MPADVPVVEQPVNAWQRWFWLWHVFFAIDYLVTVGLVLAETGSATARTIAVAAITAIALSYPFSARRQLTARGELVFAAAVLLLAAVAILATSAAGFALFAVCPMVFMSAPMPVAVVVVSLMILLPPLSAWLRNGFGDPSMSVLLPITALLIIFSICIGFWFERVLRQSQERAQLIEQLEATRAEVARLSHEAGTSAERERLAREIHDTLAQGFTSILTLLQAVESEWGDEKAMRRHVDLAARTARDNLAEARAMVAALTPSALASGTLEDAVRRQTERLHEESAIEVSFMPGDLPTLGTATEVVLLRAAQEALTNARRHSGASRISVELSAVDGRVRLTVTDDGRGFDPGNPTEGFGLKGMRARAEQVGGTLAVHSGPGTTVTVEVPA